MIRISVRTGFDGERRGVEEQSPHLCPVSANWYMTGAPNVAYQKEQNDEQDNPTRQMATHTGQHEDSVGPIDGQ